MNFVTINFIAAVATDYDIILIFSKNVRFCTVYLGHVAAKRFFHSKNHIFRGVTDLNSCVIRAVFPQLQYFKISQIPIILPNF